MINIAVQVNGKQRATIVVAPDASKEDIMAVAKADVTIAKHTEGKVITKEIVVPGKMINFVVR